MSESRERNYETFAQIVAGVVIVLVGGALVAGIMVLLMRLSIWLFGLGA